MSAQANNCDFLFQMMDLLGRETDKEDAGERFDMDPDSINVEYHFPKKNGVVHDVYIHNGNYDNVFRLRVVANQTTNRNSEVLADRTYVLQKSELERFLNEYMALLNKINRIKYPKSDKDILMTICPELLDQALLDGTL